MNAIALPAAIQRRPFGVYARVLATQLLHDYWFHSRGVKLWKRIAIASGVCWVGEWVGGFLAVELTGKHLHVWPGTALVYVSFPALFLWVSNVIIYHLLTLYVIDLTPAYDAPADA